MDPELRKKLTVPFIVLLGILGINANSIVNGISQHNSTRIVIACISTAIVMVVFVLMVRNAKKGGNS